MVKAYKIGNKINVIRVLEVSGRAVCGVEVVDGPGGAGPDEQLVVWADRALR